MSIPDGTVRVAVAGAGQWGANHVRTWADLGLLGAVCDPDESRLDSVRPSSGNARLTTEFDSVLEDQSITAVVVAAPARLHEALALGSIDAGKDVLVEKPLALTMDSGRRIVQRAADRGCVLAVGHLLEYHPAVLELRRMIAEGRLGRLDYVYSHRLNLGRFRSEENALWSFAPHDIALILRLADGDPTEVSCHGGSYLQMGIADVTTTHLTFDGGLRAHVFVSWLHPFKEQRFVVVGSEGMAVFDDTAPWPEKLVIYPHSVSWIDGHAPVANRAQAEPVLLEPSEPLRAECEHFAACIAERGRPLTDGESALRVLDVLARAERSLRAVVTPAAASWSGDVFVHPTATIDEDVVLGSGTKIWHYVHVSARAQLGRDCVLGQNAYVASGVKLGDGVRVQNNVSIYEGVELDDDVFCGPSAVFTNVLHPRSAVSRKGEYRTTHVGRGASLGANCTIVCGNTIGPYAFVGAGAVVTTDVPAYALVMGVPARQVGWACQCGEHLESESPRECPRCASRYDLRDGLLECVGGPVVGG